MTHIFHRLPAKTMPTAVRGDGCFIVDQSGKRYFDGSGGAAVSCLGHGNAAVIDAVHKQISALEYSHTSFFTSAAAEELADFLIAASPKTFSKVYLLSGGSEAVETALKMARQYFVAIGEPSRHRFISRRQSYHGNTLGALSVGGNMARRELYQPIMTQGHHVSPCFAFRYREPGETDDAYGNRLAAELDTTIMSLGPQTVAGFIAETVVGATSGAVAAVPGYFEKMKRVCDRHGVLLILDEIMSGIGRTGTYHAFEQENVIPDIVTLAKGLGGGYQPIGAVIASEKIVDGITSNGAFQHGHTYVDHPVACAAALAVQKVIRNDALVARVNTMGDYLHGLLQERFKDHPHVADIRGRGLLRAIELVADRSDNRPFAPQLRLHAHIKEIAQQHGLLCYPNGGTIDGVNGDHVLLAPPFICSEQECHFAVDTLGAAIDLAIARAH